MEKSVSVFRATMPQILKACADWFQVDVTIKLFGIKVFAFTWPPKAESEENIQVELPI